MFTRLYFKVARNYIKMGGSKAHSGIAVGVFGSIAFMAFAFWFFNKIFSYLARLEQFPLFFIHGLAERFFSMVFLTVFSMIVLSSLITSISTFFNSRELQLLYTFPIDRWRIFTKKTIESVLYSSYLLILLAIPALVAYGRNFALGFHIMTVAVMAFLVFVVGPCLIGASMTVILIAYLPIRRVHQFLTGVLAVVFIVLVFLFRMMNPEKLINPVSTMDFILLLNSISEPAARNYPNYWLAAAIVALAKKDWGTFFRYGSFIVYLNIAGMVLLSVVLKAVYARSWNRSQSTLQRKIKPNTLSRLIWKLSFFRPSSRALLVKELVIFSRDPTQWSQVFLLIALVVVYIYNIKNIPVPVPSAQIIIAYINIALSGFVLAALGMRFVFPSVSLEGQASWILFTSPVDMRKYFQIKQILYFIILFSTSQAIIWLSNYYLGASLKIMIISAVINFEFVIAILGMGLGLGSIFKDFTIDNPIKLASTFGGILFMVLSFGAIGFIILIEAYPVYLSFKEQLGFVVSAPSEWIFHSGAFIFALLCYYVPLRIGTNYMR